MIKKPPSAGHFRQTVGGFFVVFSFAFAFLERIQVVEKMVADFL